MTIRFLKHCVTDGNVRARCWYHLDNRTDGRKCVTIYSKDYTSLLGQIFHTAGATGVEYKNDTDLMTDYFDKGRAVVFEGSPLYAAARARAEQNIADREHKQAKLRIERERIERNRQISHMPLVGFAKAVRS